MGVVDDESITYNVAEAPCGPGSARIAVDRVERTNLRGLGNDVSVTGGSDVCNVVSVPGS